MFHVTQKLGEAYTQCKEARLFSITRGVLLILLKFFFHVEDVFFNLTSLKVQ